MSESMIRAVRAVFLTLAVIVGIIMLVSILRVGFAFWLFSYIANWATIRLGLDYYMSEFLAVLLSSAIMYAIPGFGGLVISKRKRLVGNAVVVGGYLVVCLLVYTVGRNVYFNRVNGEPLRYYADTPDGREFSFTPGFHPRWGLPYRPYTQEVVNKEIEEQRLRLEIQRRENAERARAEMERQRKQQAIENKRLEEQARREQAERIRAQEEARHRLDLEEEKVRLQAEAQRNADRIRQAEAEAEAQRQAIERQRLVDQTESKRQETERLRLEAENRRRQIELDRLEAEKRRQEELEQQRREERARREREDEKRRSDERKKQILNTIHETVRSIRSRRPR